MPRAVARSSSPRANPADATPAELEARQCYHRPYADGGERSAAKEALSRVPSRRVEIDPQDHRITAFPETGQADLRPVSDLLKTQYIQVSELQSKCGRLM